MADEKPPAPATEQPIGFGYTAVYVNRHHLWANEQVMRFVMADSIQGDDVQTKFTFVMSRADAESLSESIVELLKRTAPKADG